MLDTAWIWSGPPAVPWRLSPGTADDVALARRIGAVRGELSMTQTAGPRITGINHFSATITDLEASVAWYQRLFGLDRVPFDFRHYEREETGYGVVLMEPRLGIAIGLHANTANRGEAFGECRTGLNHISFGAADRDGLAAWVARLDELGIQHTGIRDEKEPMACSTVVFRDPDLRKMRACTLF